MIILFMTGMVTERMRDNLEDEGQLPLHHRDKNTGDHLPVVFMDFPVLECEWIEYSDIDINTRSYRQGVYVYFLTSVRISPWFCVRD